jgi:hypothetical protein
VENLVLVDWDSLRIVETHDDEGRIKHMMTKVVLNLLVKIICVNF